jgi:hypothetical protein
MSNLMKLPSWTYGLPEWKFANQNETYFQEEHNALLFLNIQLYFETHICHYGIDYAIMTCLRSLLHVGWLLKPDWLFVVGFLSGQN